MLHPIAPPGLSCRPYFHRYTDDAVDLCDVLSSFGRTKATLHEISGMLGFAGKASGIDGGQVEQLVAEGRIAEVAAYCLWSTATRKTLNAFLGCSPHGL
jgi:3'-5' exonuclease